MGIEIYCGGRGWLKVICGFLWIEIYCRDSGCLELFNLKCFRTGLRRHPSGKGGKTRLAHKSILKQEI